MAIINNSEAVSTERKAEMLDEIIKLYLDATHYNFEANPRAFRSPAEKFGYDAYNLLVDSGALVIAKQLKINI